MLGFPPLYILLLVSTSNDLGASAQFLLILVLGILSFIVTRLLLANEFVEIGLGLWRLHLLQR